MHVHFLRPAQVRRAVFVEAAGHEGAGRIAPCEDGILRAGPIEVRRRADVVDAAIERDVQRETGICAVVKCKLGRVKAERAVLEAAASEHSD